MDALGSCVHGQADYATTGLNRSPYDVARTHGHITCLRVLEVRGLAVRVVYGEVVVVVIQL